MLLEVIMPALRNFFSHVHIFNTRFSNVGMEASWFAIRLIIVTFSRVPSVPRMWDAVLMELLLLVETRITIASLCPVLVAISKCRYVYSKMFAFRLRYFQLNILVSPTKQECPDGTFVVPDPQNSCTFFDCPGCTPDVSPIRTSPSIRGFSWCVLTDRSLVLQLKDPGMPWRNTGIPQPVQWLRFLQLPYMHTWCEYLWNCEYWQEDRAERLPFSSPYDASTNSIHRLYTLVYRSLSVRVSLERHHFACPSPWQIVFLHIPLPLIYP